MADIAPELLDIPAQPVYFGVGVIISSILFFVSLNLLVTVIGAPNYIRSDFWKWRNLLISWIHAIIVGIWDILCFYFYPEMWSDLILFHSPFIYIMVAFSTGYFIYDFFDIIATGRIKSSWEVAVHHVFVAGIFGYNVMTCRCIAYNVLALMAEINSMFLHSRKMLQMHRVDFKHPVYKITTHLNLLTFVFGRFGGLAAIAYGMIYWSDRVSTQYFMFLSSSMFVMGGINIVLFWRLIKNDVFRRAEPSVNADLKRIYGVHPFMMTNNNSKETNRVAVTQNGDTNGVAVTQNGAKTQNGALLHNGNGVSHQNGDVSNSNGHLKTS